MVACSSLYHLPDEVIDGGGTEHRICATLLQGWGQVQLKVPRYRYRYFRDGQVQVQVQDFSEMPRYRYF